MKTSLFDFSIWENRTFRSGMIFYLISLIFLGIASSNNQISIGENSFLFVWVNLFFFLIYFIALGSDNRKRTGRFWKFNDLRKNIPLLLILFSSAFTLNTQIKIFENSVEWLQGLLVLSNLALVTFCFRPRPLQADAINFSILFVLSLGFMFGIYGSIYVIPLYGISVVMVWFFGLTLHSFVPIWFTITTFKIINQFSNTSSTFRNFTFVSMSIPLFFAIFFCSKWNGLNKNIQNTIDQNHIEQKSLLPDWVSISQNIDGGWATEKILKSGIFYTTAEFDDIFTIEPRNFGRWSNEEVFHDPFVIIASLFFGEINIPFNDRTKIIRSMYTERHEMEERLWSGSNLSTTDVETAIQLFPEHRLSYTEKTFIIHNNIERTWRTQQEAIYSFYLPEGAVVTSASLWIFGKEEKSYLTTREKADEAYKTIVGRERRDPLLLHWQEGNRISVRVFPCTPKEDRKFKIGITAPLKKEGNKLTYQDITMEGPKWQNANETVKVYQEGKVSNLKIPFSTEEKENYLEFSGRYHQDWTMTMDTPPLAYSSFSFNGRNLRVNDLLDLTETFEPKFIYLDINNSWSRRQCNKIWNSIQDKRVFVFTDKLHQVTAENYKRLFDELRQQRFSIFPFHKIENVERSLVITQGQQYTPTLKDLDASYFSRDLKKYISSIDAPIRIFNLGKNTTPYLKTLRDLKVFNFQSDTPDQLEEQLTNNRFPEYQNDSTTVVIPAADIVIKTHEGEREINNAPDHLLRLFAYNDIMKKMGSNYFHLNDIADELIAEAKEAYVVTPISSLITLETQEDYDRFDIKKSENSLQNASIKGAGSVPEPHEWFLILLCLMTLLFLKFRA